MIGTPCKLTMTRFSLLLAMFALVHLSFPTSALASTEQKVQTWIKYYEGKSGDSFYQVRAFMTANPNWPAQRAMQLHAESKLDSSLPDKDLLAWFHDYPPITPAAADIYADVMKRSGQVSKSSAYLQIWWEEAVFEREQQKEFYQKHKQDLSAQSHKRRLNMLLFKGDKANALGIADVLGRGYRELALARLALANEEPGAATLLEQVPSHLQNDPGLIYERLRWRRRNDLDAGAIAMLAQAPPADQMHDPAAWWLERHILARRLIEDKKYKQAYQIVSTHRQVEGLPFAQAEWLAGWLALRFNNEPWKGFQHFEKLYKNVETPISKSRAAYWAGVASQSLKHQEIAQQWFVVAANYDTTFYGQMAKAQLEEHPEFKKRNNASLKLHAPPRPGTQELVEALQILTRMGRKKESAFFLAKLRQEAANIVDLKYNAETANRLGYSELSIKAAMEAVNKYDIVLYELAYPQRVNDVRNIHDVEWALVHAIMRQESRFDELAVSPAGARGLMQLMPATAKNTARSLGISHQTDWLTQKPSHNIRLGSTYIKKMLDRYDQNYAMAIAAYNAGPGRVDEWIRVFGDPRKGQISMIDWIECIPIYETRNYVQRVLESVYVYRGLLKDVQRNSQHPIHVSMR